MSGTGGANIYEQGLDKTGANFEALSPLSFLARTADIYPDNLAVSYGEVRRSWSETYARCRRLASALSARGIGKGDTVAVAGRSSPMIRIWN
ncbi:AMP-binding protein [Mangrovicoccus ximenensis]|uniref:AMP-binding protein n=1 Tax=Mangrovicoccus ximenensis TaxID=1911570 RepID=UPI000D3D0DE9